MKNRMMLMFWLFGVLGAQAQSEVASDSTGLPGDQFSLEGALTLFQKAESPEDFEKSLNDESSQVNNLDLNGDDETDYIRVISKTEEETHIFVLQVPVSENESQDIAVIELEKTGNEEAHLQIIGDEEIFGVEIIVEPGDPGQDEGVESKKGGPSLSTVNTAQIVINVWSWSCVRYVYRPGYRPWVSPWGWRHYPGWWRPWRPLGWSFWRPVKVRHYSPTIRIVHKHRLNRAHGMYKPIRVHSTTVRTRHAGVHSNYKVSRTKTTIKGPRGKTTTHTRTTVKKSRRG